MSRSDRNILLVPHTGREDALAAAVRVAERLRAAGARPVLPVMERDEAQARGVDLGPIGVLGFGALEGSVALGDVEIAIALGGDGTILRTAEVVREAGLPIVGVNLGHVGFLAEAERDQLDTVVTRVLAGDWEVEERLALDVRVTAGESAGYRTWALNEATLERASRERMLDVAVEVDQRPVSSFGCDGVIFSTPTGSTAYAFSAGGPVMWPGVEAILLVPLSAHALFARPLVVGPNAVLAVEITEHNTGPGVLWCDGRRSCPLPVGSRVEITRSDRPVRLARLHGGSFTDRLVRKFRLPVTGWRGPVE